MRLHKFLLDNNMIKTKSKFYKGFFLLLVLFFAYTQTWATSGPPRLYRACQSGSDVNLYWTPPADTCGSFTSYMIYARKTTADPFTILDSVLVLSQTSYLHIGGAIPIPSWEYFIVCLNDCNGFPTTASDTITVDLTPPPNTDPDSVSINPFTGEILIGWNKNTTADLDGYTLYEEVGSQTLKIEDVRGLFYKTSAYNTKDSTHTFKIAAFDSCGNLSPSITTHTTIKLIGALDDCAGKLELTWTDYKGWAGVQKYEIHVSRNNSVYIPEQIVDGNTLSYTLDQIVSGDIIKVFIRAISSLDNNISSSSNLFSDSIPSVKLPTINYLSLVSVVNNTHVQVKWITDPAGEISIFKIRRGKDILNMDVIADVIFDPLKSEYIYEDKDSKASFDKTIYYYQIEVYDNCKNPTGSFSNISNTIVTTLNPANDTQNIVSWNKYSFFNLGVGYYYVYRGLEFDGQYTWKIIGSATPNVIDFIDDSPPSEGGNTGICYKVEAFENPGNPLTSNQEISTSSRSCELKDFKIFFPNAFNPFGVNRKWVPKGSYINYDKTEVSIYNSWGQFITKITDIHKGWDGKDDKGEWMLPGSYIFYATITGVNKRKETQKGDFLFLR